MSAPINNCCPDCGETLSQNPLSEGYSKNCLTTSEKNAARRCDHCKCVFSNNQNIAKATRIYDHQKLNLPPSVDVSALEAVCCCALNENKRQRKWEQIAWCTSEDAVTWAVFSDVAKMHGGVDAIAQSLGLKGSFSSVDFWGASQSTDGALSKLLKESFGEKPKSLGEPDMILEGKDELAFVEAKLRKQKSKRIGDYEKYLYPSSSHFIKEMTAIKLASECDYQLVRHWSVGCKFAGSRRYQLVSLVPHNYVPRPMDELLKVAEIDEKHITVTAIWEDVIRSLNFQGYLQENIYNWAKAKRVAGVMAFTGLKLNAIKKDQYFNIK